MGPIRNLRSTNHSYQYRPADRISHLSGFTPSLDIFEVCTDGFSENIGLVSSSPNSLFEKNEQCSCSAGKSGASKAQNDDRIDHDIWYTYIFSFTGYSWDWFRLRFVARERYEETTWLGSGWSTSNT